MRFIDSQTAFGTAIAHGLLSADPESRAFAGDYMYMGTEQNEGLERHTFKHINTRRYIYTSWTKKEGG